MTRFAYKTYVERLDTLKLFACFTVRNGQLHGKPLIRASFSDIHWAGSSVWYECRPRTAEAAGSNPARSTMLVLADFPVLPGFSMPSTVSGSADGTHRKANESTFRLSPQSLPFLASFTCSLWCRFLTKLRGRTGVRNCPKNILGSAEWCENIFAKYVPVIRNS